MLGVRGWLAAPTAAPTSYAPTPPSCSPSWPARAATHRQWFLNGLLNLHPLPSNGLVQLALKGEEVHVGLGFWDQFPDLSNRNGQSLACWDGAAFPTPAPAMILVLGWHAKESPSDESSTTAPIPHFKQRLQPCKALPKSELYCGPQFGACHCAQQPAWWHRQVMD